MPATGLVVIGRSIYPDHGFDANRDSYPGRIARQAVTQLLAANG
ncbi:hypothetical protein [Lentzea aerocolonigenes]|nr:hypothetical protein [Lentzea aerocolonigenes]